MVLVLLVWPSLAAAQRTSRGGPPPPPPPATAFAPIGLPLPPIGLPLPPLGISTVDGHVSKSSVARSGRNGSRSRRSKGFFGAPAVIYFGSTYESGISVSGPVMSGSAQPEIAPIVYEPPTGLLRLDLQPAAALQFFVDGQFVGTPEDMGMDLELEAGVRRIEVRAPGYEPLVLDAKIVADRAITYRGTLTRARDAAQAATPPVAVAAGPEPAVALPFYYIPGCYMGTVPPKEVKLPAGCDASRVITRMP